MSRSISAIAARSSKVSVTSWSTSPSMVRRPVVDVDDGQREPGVDAVEVAGRGAERRDAVVPSPPGRSGRAARGRRRPGRATSVRPGRSDVIQRPAPPWRRRPRRARRRRPARRAGGDGRTVATAGAGSACPGRVDAVRASQAARRRRPTAATRAGTQVGERRRRAGDGRARRRRRHEHDQQARRRSASRAAGEQAGDGGEQQHDDQHRADQDRLVGVPNCADRPLLERGRREVDDGRADREHRRGRRVGQRGDEVAGGDPDERWRGRRTPARSVQSDCVMEVVRCGGRSGSVRVRPDVRQDEPP